MWREQVRHLGGTRVLTPALGGFAGLPRGTVTMTDMAEDVAAAMSAAGVERATVAGVSMGGYVALELVARHPARVARLLLADTRPGADSAETAQGREEQAARALADGPSALADELVVKLLGTTTLRERPDLAAEVKGWIGVAPRDAFAGAQRGMAARRDRSALLPTITVPTAVVVGAEDVITPPDVARAMAAAIPGATLHVIDRAGHLANLEAPEAWNAALDALLQR